MKTRCSGVLLPIASLPAAAGIGNLGEAARTFVNFLADCGQGIWQILPLNIPDSVHSPYASASAFAGYPLLLSPQDLAEDGLLSPKDLPPALPPSAHIDYTAAERYLTPLFRRAYAMFRSSGGCTTAEYTAFLQRERYWLPGHALFDALRIHFGEDRPSHWPDETIRRHDPDAVHRYTELLAEEIDYRCFLQYEFSRQLASLRACLHRHGIRLCGDIPFYVSEFGADVWEHPVLFNTSKAAGVPPDFFSRDGQLWGNPIYEWDRMAADGYDWWIHRLVRCHDLWDITRLDHFRALYNYYAVPKDADTARNGSWYPGPGCAFLAAVQKSCPQISLVAEDLGDIPPEVGTMRREAGIPGMCVLQFAFGGGADNPFLPHNYSRSCFVYTGTHDNDTTVGFWESASGRVRRHAADYLGIPFNASGEEAVQAMMRAISASAADTVIFPMQDLLASGSECRINTPGRIGCWTYSLPPDYVDARGKEHLKSITRLYGRWNGE